MKASTSPRPSPTGRLGKDHAAGSGPSSDPAAERQAFQPVLDTALGNAAGRPGRHAPGVPLGHSWRTAWTVGRQGPAGRAKGGQALDVLAMAAIGATLVRATDSPVVVNERGNASSWPARGNLLDLEADRTVAEVAWDEVDAGTLCRAERLAWREFGTRRAPHLSASGVDAQDADGAGWLRPRLAMPGDVPLSWPGCGQPLTCVKFPWAHFRARSCYWSCRLTALAGCTDDNRTK